MKKLDAYIASPTWEACKTCRHSTDNGCEFSGESLNFSLYLGDFILCDAYEKESDAGDDYK